MTITNLSSTNSTQKKVISENIKAIEAGIKKKLLEKYKPKGLYKIDTIREINDEERVA